MGRRLFETRTRDYPLRMPVPPPDAPPSPSGEQWRAHGAAPNRYADNWRHRDYHGVRSTSLSQAPERLQRVAVELLRKAVIEEVRRIMGDRPIRRVIDAACGPGDWAMAWAALGARVSGFDVNPAFIAAARQRAAEGLPQASFDFSVADLIEYDAWDGADIVALGACVMYVDDAALEDLLAKLSHALTPGAAVYVRATVPNPLQPSLYHPFGCYRDRSVYQRAFERRGFRLARPPQTSLQVVLDAHLVRRLRSLGPGLSAAISGPSRLLTMLRREREFCNWFLVRQ